MGKNWLFLSSRRAGYVPVWSFVVKHQRQGKSENHRQSNMPNIFDGNNVDILQGFFIYTCD